MNHYKIIGRTAGGTYSKPKMGNRTAANRAVRAFQTREAKGVLRTYAGTDKNEEPDHGRTA